MGKNHIARIGIVLLIASAAAWQCIGAWQDSQTTDEAVHLSAGLSYWQTGQFQLNPEHPALFKLIAAFPLLFDTNARISTTSAAWASHDQWWVGREFLYHDPPTSANNSQRTMFLGRLPMILLWLGGVCMLATFLWRRYGPWPSLAGVAVLSYDPNLFGHGHLVTNDVLLAFAYLAVFLTLSWLITRVGWKRVFVFGVVFALTQLTKFSAAILWLLVPMVIGLAVIYRRPGMSWVWWWRILATCVVMTGVSVWAVYGFQLTTISSDSRIAELWQERTDLVQRSAIDTVPPYTQTFIRLTNPDTAVGKALQSFSHATVPTYWYWRGFFSAASHNAYGHAGFILGLTSNTGWWFYFPVALWFKTPLLLLALLIISLGLQLSRGVRSWLQRRSFTSLPFDFWLFGFPPIMFLLWSMTSHINIGIRHILPTYIFFPIAAASLLTNVERWRPKLLILSSSVIAALSVLVTVSAWPHTIGYFNSMAGGTTGGHRVLLDSNIDWNQDYRRLRSFLNQEHLTDVQFAIFGSIPIEAYFDTWRPVPHDADIARGLQPSGVIAISDGQLYNKDGPFHWLQKATPRWRVGSSINIYDFR